jgi:flagellar biosynthetic protein FliR
VSAPSIAQALAPAHWPTLVLVSARMVGLMLAAPLWSFAGTPKSVRGALVIVLTVTVLPTVREASLPPDYIGLVLPIAFELILGLAIGVVGAAFMAGMGLAGEVATLQMGLNLGPSLSPMSDASVTGLGDLKTMLATVIYATLGGHLVLLRGVAESLQAIPPGSALDFSEGGRAVVALGATVFTVAVRAAAPVIAALLLANLGLAILSRAVPQLNAMAVGFPITIGLGFLVFGASLPYLGPFVGRWAGGVHGSVGGLIQAFALPAGGH